MELSQFFTTLIFIHGLFSIFSSFSWLYHDPQCGLDIFGHCAELKIGKAPKHDLHNLRPCSGNQNLRQYVIFRLVVFYHVRGSMQSFILKPEQARKCSVTSWVILHHSWHKRTLPIHQKVPVKKHDFFRAPEARRTVLVHDFHNIS